MYIPKHNCIYLANFNRCNHLDRRGIIFAKECLLDNKHVKGCALQIKHERPKPPKGAKPPAYE